MPGWRMPATDLRLNMETGGPICYLGSPVYVLQPPAPVKTRLLRIAHARSGDKGNAVNVGLIARDEAWFDFLREHVTPERVKAHFGPMCLGDVERFELPNLNALNFLLHDALGGGGTVSLKLDAQGKTYAAHLLRMEVDVPDEMLANAG
jgi:hypothetical protein